MSKLPITFACGLYDRMQALYTGEVAVEGIDLNFLAMDDPRQIFDRMAGGLEFDASEMSSSEFISRKSAGDCPFVALPVFASRVFRHSLITVNRKSGIRTPKDLEGKRVAVPLYTMTAAVFQKGMLQHDHGVDLSTIRWVQGATNHVGGHGSPTLMPLLKPISIEQNKTGKPTSDLLDEGALDAIIGTDLPEAIHRNPDVVRLFPNYREVEQDYYRRTRIFPIMHLIVIRKALCEKHPFVATSLYNAFCRSRELALQKMKYRGTLRYMLPWMTADLDEIDDIFGGDPWPYGVEPNRPTLEALMTYLQEQGLIAAKLPLEDVFAPIRG